MLYKNLSFLLGFLSFFWIFLFTFFRYFVIVLFETRCWIKFGDARGSHKRICVSYTLSLNFINSMFNVFFNKSSPYKMSARLLDKSPKINVKTMMTMIDSRWCVDWVNICLNDRIVQDTVFY
jgi:hypothetical protein